MPQRVALVVAITLGSVGAASLPAAAGRTEPTTSVAPCGSRQLRLGGTFQSGTQDVFGAVSVTNHGAAACTVRGVPRMTVTAAGHRLRVIQGYSPAHALLTGSEHGPTIVLAPTGGHLHTGQLRHAQFQLSWLNWCRRRRPRLAIRARLHRGQHSIAIKGDATAGFGYRWPGCITPGHPSRITATALAAR